VNRLIDSICSAVTSSLSCDINPSIHANRSPSSSINGFPEQPQQQQQQPTNNLKVHLEIGRRRETRHTHDKAQHQNTTTTSTSADRYLTSRKYKDMIFPPPNREEAEKVSTYIEQQIMNCQKRRQTYRDKHRLYHSDETSLSHKSPKTTCRNNCLTHHNNDVTKDNKNNRCRRTQKATRANVTEEEKFNAGVLITTTPLIHSSNVHRNQYKNFNNQRRRASCDVSVSDHSLSPSSSLSGSNSSFSSDEMLINQNNRTEKESGNRRKSSLRFRHSCSCRRKPPKLDYCNNIYATNTDQRRRKSIDNCNLNSNMTTAATKNNHSPSTTTTTSSHGDDSSRSSAVSSDTIQNTKRPELTPEKVSKARNNNNNKTGV